MTFVTVTAKPLSQQLQVVLRVPPGDSELHIARGTDFVAFGAQVEIMAGAGVPSDTAAVALAQEVAADLSCSRHVHDVLTQAVAQECLHFGAVRLWRQNNTEQT